MRYATVRDGLSDAKSRGRVLGQRCACNLMGPGVEGRGVVATPLNARTYRLRALSPRLANGHGAGACISVREREMDGPIPGRCVAIEPAAFLLSFAVPRHLRRMWACSWCFFTLSRTRSSRARCPVGHRNALFLWTGSPPRSCPVPFPAGRRESRRLAAASFELLIITASPLAGSLSRAPCVSPRFC